MKIGELYDRHGSVGVPIGAWQSVCVIFYGPIGKTTEPWLARSASDAGVRCAGDKQPKGARESEGAGDKRESERVWRR